MKKLLFILLFLPTFLMGQRQFSEFPEETDPDSTDIVISYDGTINEKIKLINILVDSSVKARNISSEVAGTGLGQLGTGALKVNVDGTTVGVNGSDQLYVISAGSFAGQGTYTFTDADYSDTLLINVNDDDVIFYVQNGDDMTFYINGYQAAQFSDVYNIFFYNGNVVFRSQSDGAFVDSVIHFNTTSSDAMIWSGADGSTLYFSDGETGQTYTLVDLVNTAFDLSGQTNNGFLYNKNGVLTTSSNLTYDDTDYQVDLGRLSTISGTHATVLGGYQNTSTNSYTFSLGNGSSATGPYGIAFGNNNVASGTYTFSAGIGNTAHDLSESVLGRYATIATGNQGSVVNGNRIFAIGNGITSGSRSNVFECYQNGAFVVEDSLRAPILKATTDLEVRDTNIIDLITEHAPAGGEVDTTGLPVANQLAVFTLGNKIKGEDSLLWEESKLKITGSQSVNGIDIYTGSANPTSTSSILKVDADFGASDLYAIAQADGTDNSSMTYNKISIKNNGLDKFYWNWGAASNETSVLWNPGTKTTGHILMITEQTTDVLLIDGGGDTWIGGMLEIDDSIIVNEYVRADSFMALSQTYADYVFEPNYNINSLAWEVAYAQRNKTLYPLRNHSNNISKRLENTVESVERLYLQTYTDILYLNDITENQEDEIKGLKKEIIELKNQIYELKKLLE